jgi:hypothetical protein
MFFCKDSKSKDGKQSECKQCKSVKNGKYYKAHPEKRLYYYSKEDSLRKYHKNKVHQNVARLVRRGLENSIKSQKTFDMLGYSVGELKAHLEKQFLPGMTWDNYGIHGWHIDHKTPRSKLIYDGPTHPNFKKCWCLENLQPLWAYDNLSKGDKTL